ncbi:multidrug resistance protein MdtA [Candidatus Phycosocius bacilliformis]|uniref:Multidrug resistance protein MdtA n=1 Tax=Candidatus Phycosocius bacilliformis TaxID=1445552 RepID=A0A2P2E7A6_9PROT|nr:efflux RND transporter periplasmic adaptor subunit [Candidatus Phycosocius bacilliformis]GBF56934.1 multidrug resistance protein MdtA [Candidatus Phycosocius bacilliformis]
MTRNLNASSLVLVVAALALAGCGSAGGNQKADASKKTAEASKNKKGERTPQAVSVAAIETKSFVGRLVVAGQVQAIQEARVFPTASGARVIQIMADAGDRVVAGQALARLDGRQINADSELLAAQVRRARTTLAEAEVGLTAARQNLARAENGPRESSLDLAAAQIAFEQAEAEYQRALAVRGDGALSTEQLEARRAAARQAEARVRTTRGDIAAQMDARRQAVAQAAARVGAARADLDVAIAQQAQSNSRQNNGLITAPVAGQVISRSVNVGEVAGTSGQPMFVIVANDALEVAAEVPESEIARLVLGMSAEFTAPDGSKVTGTLRRLPAQIDPQRRTGIARFTLAANPAVKSGVFLTGTAISLPREINAVPATAVLYGREGASVFVLRPDQTVTKAKVTLGAREGAMVELIAGPPKGTVVVTAGSAFLAEGEKVNAVRANAAPPAPAPKPPQK